MYASANWRTNASLMASITHSPTSIFSPAATPAHSIYNLSLLVFGIIGGIFLVVGGLLLYAMLKYRHRPKDANATQEPAQIYGSNQIELSWTVIPILIVVMLFLATARVIFVNEHARKPADALKVTVIGHQFWWEYRYPALGVITANELHVPVGDSSHPTPSYLTMSSADVDHSFWVPRLAGKLDLIPNKVNVMWIDPQHAGLYLGQCAQYCGAQHAKMLIASMPIHPSSSRRGSHNSSSHPDRTPPLRTDEQSSKAMHASVATPFAARWLPADLAPT